MPPHPASSSATTTLLQTAAPRPDQMQLYETGLLQTMVNSVKTALTINKSPYTESNKSPLYTTTWQFQILSSLPTNHEKWNTTYN
eukprot:5678844-Amphidinium_carterae.2